MKRLSQMAMRTKNQKGVDPVDAIFAMIIASMIAAAIMTLLGSWFTIRAQTASQDSANQYAQGVLAKTSSVEWSSLGFKAGVNSPAIPSGSEFTEATCPTAYRAAPTIGDKTYKTVTSDPAAADVSQTAITKINGKEFCVITDVTWDDTTVPNDHPSNAYGTKNVSVKISWRDGGTPRSISVNSLRSPNVGEAIPSGLVEGKDAEVSPIKSFDVTRAHQNGEYGIICYRGDWNDTSDTIKVIGAPHANLSGSPQTTVTLTPADKLQEKCMTINSVDYFYYGLIVTDAAGTKFRSTADYQFPGNKITASGSKITWNTYSSTGTTKYRVMKSSDQYFDSSTQVAEISDSSYTLTEPGTYYVKVDTVNTDYSVIATSNVVTVTVGEVEPAAAPSPSPTATPVATACFSDVPTSHQYYTDICWAKDKGVVTGFPDGTYQPEAAVTREAMSAFLYRLAGSPEYTAPTTPSFSDVPTSHQFYKHIEWMKSRAITTGYGDGTYRPTEPVDRNAMAAFMYRFEGSPAYSAPTNSWYPDISSADIFYKEMSWIYDSAMFTGYPEDGSYRPYNDIRRDEMASFMYRWNLKYNS